jgi:hypothetical protein
VSENQVFFQKNRSFFFVFSASFSRPGTDAVGKRNESADFASPLFPPFDLPGSAVFLFPCSDGGVASREGMCYNDFGQISGTSAEDGPELCSDLLNGGKDFRGCSRDRTGKARRTT